MPKLVCKKCEVEYVIEKTGAVVIDMFSDPPAPYQIWQADGWKCPKCGNEVIAGFADYPVAEHYQDSFYVELTACQSSLAARSGWMINNFEWPPVS